jgi:hypothetical protein
MMEDIVLSKSEVTEVATGGVGVGVYVLLEEGVDDGTRDVEEGVGDDAGGVEEGWMELICEDETTAEEAKEDDIDEDDAIAVEVAADDEPDIVEVLDVDKLVDPTALLALIEREDEGEGELTWVLQAVVDDDKALVDVPGLEVACVEVEAAVEVGDVTADVATEDVVAELLEEIEMVDDATLKPAPTPPESEPDTVLSDTLDTVAVGLL